MHNQSFRFVLFAAILSFVLPIANAVGQGNLQDFNNQDPTTIQDPTGGVDNLGNQNGGGVTVGGAGGGSDFGNLDGSLFDRLNQGIEDVDDGRDLGFVGPSAENLGGGFGDSAPEPLGHVGPTIETITGVEFTGQPRSGTGLGDNADSPGFEVIRANNFRTRMRPAFRFTPRSNTQSAVSFQNRIRRLPSTQQQAPGVQISVTGQTATISGTVDSPDAARRVVQQLRLMPGVYRIKNELNISRSIGAR